ncbi:hypothetical protein P3U41_06195 [Mammaliicoccus sciuri]|uniref:hypothetical protein n=1 Tax=Mammaliicoccus sciuri TaxID=1296 RepID=UPI002B258552|nr:hypothetical protein [Mammaliicoccus sciuri]WQL34362.1 hypothetical protein P3U41_06195 [Mammaliicoccus sciuri]WQL61301.1 hypothetical protein P3T96_06195 [Mammaliicoccus sciuri]
MKKLFNITLHLDERSVYNKTAVMEDLDMSTIKILDKEVNEIFRKPTEEWSLHVTSGYFTWYQSKRAYNRVNKNKLIDVRTERGWDNLFKNPKLAKQQLEQRISDYSITKNTYRKNGEFNNEKVFFYLPSDESELNMTATGGKVIQYSFDVVLGILDKPDTHGEIRVYHSSFEGVMTALNKIKRGIEYGILDSYYLNPINEYLISITEK